MVQLAVGIGKIEAALIDVVGGPQDLDAVADKVSVGLAQGRIAADLECDVAEADFSALGG